MTPYIVSTCYLKSFGVVKMIVCIEYRVYRPSVWFLLDSYAKIDFSRSKKMIV